MRAVQASLIELRKIEIFVPGEPVTEGSLVPFIHRGTGRACVKPENERELKQWRGRIGTYAKLRWQGPPTSNPIKLSALFQLPRVVMTSAGPRRRSGRLPARHGTGDLDKLVRSIGDALAGIVYENDSQICSFGETDKIFADDGMAVGVAIHIEELEE